METISEYVNDGNRNYLKVSCGEVNRKKYPYRMITENEIKGLLPCRARVINGDTYMYYEIQSKQAMYYRYEIKEITYDALKDFFFYFCLLGEELEKYLLDIHEVMFDEKYIYQNMESGEVGFLYLPDGICERKSFASFMEYIVKRVNHKDSKAVETSYRLYDLSRRDHICMEDIKKLFEEEEKSQNMDTYLPPAPQKIQVAENTVWEEETTFDAGSFSEGKEKKKKMHLPLLSAFGKKKSKPEKMLWEMPEEETWEPTDKQLPIQEETKESYGETVFFEPEPENVLCGLGKYDKILIKLEHFPFSIGKLKEEADYVLKDSSVSRLHVRFYQQDKSVYIVDMNSTNGTFKNGFRIPPNEKMLLEEGDEIAIGKIRFCYR